MRQVLEQYMVLEERAYNFALVEYEGGSANVYLGEDGMMVNHVSGDALWDLFVGGAHESDWLIMAPGSPVCITEEDQRSHLPVELADHAVLVASGNELVSVIVSR